MSIQTDAAGTALATRRARRTHGSAPPEEQAPRRGTQPRRATRARQPLISGRGSGAGLPAPRQHPSSRRGSSRNRPPRVARRLRGSSLRRGIQRLRVPLALLLGVCAVGAGVLAGGETQVETTTAVRVTSPMAAGQELSPGDLEETEVDVEAVPEGHLFERDALVGQRTAVPLPAGALVLDAHLVGPGLLQGQEAGVVAVPVRPADTAMVGMLTPGQSVDVLVSADSIDAGSSSQTLAEAAPVLWTPTSEDENWLPGAGEAGNVVIVAVEAETAEAIAQATHEGRLHLSLVGGNG